MEVQCTEYFGYVGVHVVICIGALYSVFFYTSAFTGKNQIYGQIYGLCISYGHVVDLSSDDVFALAYFLHSLTLPEDVMPVCRLCCPLVGAVCTTFSVPGSSSQPDWRLLCDLHILSWYESCFFEAL